MGQFYLDLYPREGKFDHAACFTMVSRHESETGLAKPVAAMVTNFDSPTEGKAATLPHGDVETFFHEFGHVMHNMCSEASYSKLSGTKVERDFVELPS
jgi:thimet oligopeptidase